MRLIIKTKLDIYKKYCTVFDGQTNIEGGEKNVCSYYE